MQFSEHLAKPYFVAPGQRVAAPSPPLVNPGSATSGHKLISRVQIDLMTKAVGQRQPIFLLNTCWFPIKCKTSQTNQLTGAGGQAQNLSNQWLLTPTLAVFVSKTFYFHFNVGFL